MRVYLDSNIFIYLENGNLTVDDLEKTLNGKIDNLFYSSSHIQELIEIKGEDQNEISRRINTRFNTLEKYTGNKHINDDENSSLTVTITHPFEIYNNFYDVPDGINVMKNMTNFVSEEQRDSFRAILGISTQVLNNYSPQEVIEHLSKEIPMSGMNFTQLYEYATSSFKDSFKIGLGHKIAGTFEMLDLLGYWKDKYTEKSNYARALDAGHSFYASYCDYFITNDQRTFNKANVVYEMYSIPTKPILQKPTR